MKAPGFMKSHRWQGRNPYFHFHPMQSAFSLLAVLILFALMAWVILWFR